MYPTLVGGLATEKTQPGDSEHPLVSVVEIPIASHVNVTPDVRGPRLPSSFISTVTVPVPVPVAK
jgi:hypothetical protein